MAIVKINNCGQGVNTDLMPEELPMGVWTDCHNMRFRNGFAERFRGMVNIFDAPTVTPYWIAPYGTATTRYWIHAGLTRLFADDGVSRLEITPTAAGQTISSITNVTTTATLTTAAPHGLSSGAIVQVSGTTPAAYSGTFAVTVTGADTFTYVMASDPGGAASVVGTYLAQVLLTSTIDDRWTGGTLNGIFVCTNGKDVPLYWAGNTANDLASLTGWDANERCKAIRPFKNYLIALNITKTATNYPHMVKWSDAAVPGAVPASWDETSVTGDDGENEVAETPDVIVDGLALGDMFIIYKERSMHAMTFIGQPNIFRFQRIQSESGMLARGCVANTPLGHVVLTSGDVVLNNGQSVVSIADGQVRQYIFGTINTLKSQRAFVCTNPQKNEVLICFPTVNSDVCDKAAVWNWKDRVWGFRDLNGVTYGDAGQINADEAILQWEDDDDSWASDPAGWSENEYSPNEARLLFSRTTAISAFDIGTLDYGANITSSLERKGMTFDDAYTNKLIRAVYPRIDAPVNTVINVSIGGAMSPVEAPTYSAPVPYTVGTSFKIDSFAIGRYLSIKLESTDYAPWLLRSIDIDIVPTGAH